MNRLIIFSCVVIAFFSSCIPASHCFFDPKQNKIYISKDTVKIKFVQVAKSKYVGTEHTLTPPQKEYSLANDSVANIAIIMRVETTDFRDEYYLELKKEDWQKNKVFKFHYMVK